MGCASSSESPSGSKSGKEGKSKGGDQPIEIKAVMLGNGGENTHAVLFSETRSRHFVLCELRLYFAVR